MDTETTTVPTTLVGPNGTAPGMGFVEQQRDVPLDDSTTGRGTGLPLLLGGLVVVVVFLVIVAKAWRQRGARTR